MFNPTVQLPSGGYIVIGVTEALVAIDVNSGRATKEGSIEQTATKTNLEAADEVARQLRLRDLAGLIVIDFIDMDERKNNAAVEKRMKDKLKTDRARIQVGRISGFGLMEMSRQRLRPGMIEATTQPCQACHGTGLIRSDDNLALSILRQIEEEGTRKRSREVLVRAPVGIGNFLMNQKREHIAHIEMRYGLSVRIEGDPALISPDFSLEKFKTATRVVPAPSAHVVSVDTSLMDQIDEDEAAEADEEEAPVVEAAETSDSPRPNGEDGEGKPKRRRRRRRRGRGKSGSGDGQNGDDQNGDDQNGDSDGVTKSDPVPVAASADAAADATTSEAADQSETVADADAATEAKPKPRTRSRSRSKAKASEKADADGAEATAEAPDAEGDAEKPAAKPKSTRTRSRSKTKKADDAAAKAEDAGAKDDGADEPEAAAPKSKAKAKPKVKSPEVAPEAAVAASEPAEPVAAEPEVNAEPVAAEPETVAEPAAEPAPVKEKPKRKGWWSLGG